MRKHAIDDPISKIDDKIKNHLFEVLEKIKCVLFINFLIFYAHVTCFVVTTLRAYIYRKVSAYLHL